jgi:hypothetical protein
MSEQNFESALFVIENYCRIWISKYVIQFSNFRSKWQKAFYLDPTAIFRTIQCTYNYCHGLYCFHYCSQYEEMQIYENIGPQTYT